MDAVISYVNQNDPEWYAEYKKYHISSGDDMIDGAIRYRDWGLLKYVLRSIDKNMPFIRKVHLIVERPSQVPDYINTDTVHVVYHKDFIPEELLPTYNSRTIEMLMHRIPDLDEEFVYFNDDMLIMQPLDPTDLFADGKPCMAYTKFPIGQREWGKKDVYYFPHLRCSVEAAKLANVSTDTYWLPNHGVQPQLKSNNEFVFSSLYNDIYPTLGRFRTPEDYIHYIYDIYLAMLGKIERKMISNKYLTNRDSLYDIHKQLLYGAQKQTCLNDVFTFESEQAEKYFINTINKSLSMIFQNQSKYEKRLSVAVCCIVKNENKYIQEWVDHYTSLGFDRIYLYDNNDENGESLNIISDIVQIHNLRGKKICQIGAYNHCYANFGHVHDYIAFFDADEFLELSKHASISDWVAQDKYKNYDVIKVNWLMIGDCDHVFYEDRPVQERFKEYLLSKDVQNEWKFSCNDFVKSIAKTKRGIRFVDSVHVPYKTTRACNSLGEKDICCNTTPFVYSDIVLKHYRTKSLEEYIDKINRGYPDHIVSNNQRLKYLNRYFNINKRTPEKEYLLSKSIENGDKTLCADRVSVERDLYITRRSSNKTTGSPSIGSVRRDSRTARSTSDL